MKRAKIIYRWAFNLVPYTQINLVFCEADNLNIEPKKNQREQNSIMDFQKNWLNIATLQNAFQKLLTDHNDYKSNRVTHKK